MKILWLCNIILPVIADKMKLARPVVGGWLTGLSCDLIKIEEVELAVCVPLPSDKCRSGEIHNIRYFTFLPHGNTKARFEEILEQYDPDVIHIFGTEFPHSLAMVNACKKLGLSHRCVVSIQGMTSVYAKHYYAYLPHRETVKHSFRDLLKKNNIRDGRRDFLKRGECEIQTLQAASHVIGRTDWDRACTERINPSAQYHVCNESLRPVFYEKKWDWEECEKHSIFVSQCGYPIKGFHLMLEAMADIVREFPDAKLYVTGKDPLRASLKDKLRQTYYHKYLGKLIRRYHLEGRVAFLGSLQENEMCEAYLRANVFVCCSSIENSPNSVGEAMLLGTPVVSSDVGGVKNMLTHEKEGFVYQADAPYMLAYYVKKLFRDKALQLEFSENARAHAQNTHNVRKNTDDLLGIYRRILLQ